MRTSPPWWASLPHTPLPTGRSSQSTELSCSDIQQLPTGYLFYIWQCKYVNVTLLIHRTLSFPKCVHKSVLYVCVSISVLQTGSLAFFKVYCWSKKKDHGGFRQWTEHKCRTGSAGHWVGVVVIQCRCWRLEIQVGSDDGGPWTQGWEISTSFWGQWRDSCNKHSHNCNNSHSISVLITSQVSCQVFCIYYLSWST